MQLLQFNLKHNEGARDVTSLVAYLAYQRWQEKRRGVFCLLKLTGTTTSQRKMIDSGSKLNIHINRICLKERIQFFLFTFSFILVHDKLKAHYSLLSSKKFHSMLLIICSILTVYSYCMQICLVTPPSQSSCCFSFHNVVQVQQLIRHTHHYFIQCFYACL